MIRAATSSDVPAVFALILALARYENLEREVAATEDDLRESLFPVRGERPPLTSSSPPDLGPTPSRVEALVAEDGGEVVGFALFFHSYSTFLGRSGLYLEDLFVLPEHRRRGHGRALLRRLAAIAVERGCGRFEWSVLHWNESAIEFYRSLGATQMDEWRLFRMLRPAIERLATEGMPVVRAPGRRDDGQS